MPTVAVSPSTLAHSCDLAYLRPSMTESGREESGSRRAGAGSRKRQTTQSPTRFLLSALAPGRFPRLPPPFRPRIGHAGHAVHVLERARRPIRPRLARLFASAAVSLAPSSPQRTRRKRRAQVKASAGQRLHAQAFGREFGRNAAEHGGAWRGEEGEERRRTKKGGSSVGAETQTSNPLTLALSTSLPPS